MKKTRKKEELLSPEESEQHEKELQADHLTDTLSDTQRQLESLIGNLPGMVYRCRPDRHWTMEYLNEKCRELTGYAPEDIIHNRKISYNDIIVSSDREYVRSEIAKATEKNSRFELKYRIKTKRGEIKWVLENGTGVRNKKGEIIQVEGFIQDITDLVNAENELVRAHNRLNVTLKSIGDAVITTDTKAKITFMNAVAEKLTGHNSSTSAGKHISYVLKLINMKTGKRVENPVERVLTSGKPVNMSEHTALMAQNGKEYIISDSATPITGSNGNIIGAVLVFRDDTEKYRTARKIESFSRIFEDSLNEIFILDASTRKFLYANKGAVSNLGYSLDELTGMTPTDIAFPLTDEALNELIRPLEEGTVAKNAFELNHRRRNGTHYPVEVHLQKTIFDNRDAYVAIILDKSEHKETLMSLEREQKRLEYVLEGTNSGIWEWEIESGQLTINDRWAEMLGYTMDELQPVTYDTWLKLTHPEDLQIASDLLEKHFRKEIDYYECDTRMKHKNGKWIWVLDRGMVAERGPDGKPLLMAGTHQDITDRKLAEEALKRALEKSKEADRLKSTFLATMSHELRTPLNAIIGFADLIEHDTPAAEAESFARVISSSGKHLLRLVQEIFDITIMEAGELKLFESGFSLNEFMNELFRVMLQEKSSMGRDRTNFRLVLPEESESFSLHTDKNRLRQILINLVKNAFKFTDPGTVELGYSVDRSADLIEFFVRDTGIGIPDEKKEIIFDAFRQADESLSRSHGGVGLGLAIAKNLTTLLGGSIHVASEKGEGSTFSFRLPAAAIGMESDSAENKQHAPAVTYKGNTILIAEDAESSYRLLNVILSKAGANTLWAKNGREAVDICLSDKKIDLVLMDINMPEMNGLEAAALIKAEKPELPIIAQTAYASYNDRERSQQSGCDDYIEKPIRRPLLFSKLNKFLQ
ncbi:MAG: PAS domain S-box protein [Bacteroidales bacterium]|nr:PAS domain S-box protein [Bacteroidales bacterium]